MHSTVSDLSTRARIRESALTCMATAGLDVSLRTIAQHAGVSPGLIVHHFGSKEGLRRACHERVMDTIEEEKRISVTTGDPASILAQIAELEGYAPVVGYMIRCLQEGGATARLIVDDMTERTAAYLQAGVEAGVVRPSREPANRAHMLVAMSVGILLLDLREPDGHLDMQTLPQRLRDCVNVLMLPALELYTDGLLTDSTLLDGYLAHLNHTPEESR